MAAKAGAVECVTALCLVLSVRFGGSGHEDRTGERIVAYGFAGRNKGQDRRTLLARRAIARIGGIEGRDQRYASMNLAILRGPQ